MQISQWDTNNLVKTSHRSIEKLETKLLVSQPDPPRDYSDLKPGQSASSYRQPFREPSVTHDDRILFRSGLTVADKPGESGLEITSPQGETIEHKGYGYVCPDYDQDEVVVNFRILNKEGDLDLWQQTFPEGGGTVLTLFEGEQYHSRPKWEQGRTITLSPQGELSVTGTDYDGHPQIVDIEQQGRTLLMRSSDSVEAFAPPIPLEWIIS